MKILQPLPPNEIHLWLIFEEQFQDGSLLARYRALLSPDEHQRHQRLVAAEHQQRFLLTRALIRTTLSRYLDGAPEQWRFQHNRYGRPEVILPPQIPPLRFNLSHTQGLIVCALVPQHNIGVDVENLSRRLPLHVAQRFFAPQEARALYRLAPTKQRLAFFSYWTLKEAYIKARGMGLALPLRQFAFELGPQQSLEVRFAPCLQESPQNWQFRLWQPSATHLMALAVQTPTPIQVNMQSVIPLQTTRPFQCPLLRCSPPHLQHHPNRAPGNSLAELSGDCSAHPRNLWPISTGSTRSKSDAGAAGSSCPPPTTS